MRSTISGHLRNNVVAYVALFLVLTGGTAQALDGTNTVFSDDIADGEVKTADVARGTVTSPKIHDGEVLTADLAVNAVTGDRVADGSLAGGDLADRSISGQKIGVETLAGVNVNDGSLFGADIANESLGASDIAAGAIGSSEIASGAVGSSDLAPGAFQPTDIAPKSASDPRFEIPPNAIQSDEVSANALTGADVNEATLDTPEAAYSRTDGTTTLPSDGSERIVAARVVEPGSYVVLAKASLSSAGGEFATCRLRAVRPGLTENLDTAINPTVKPSFGLPGAWEGVSMLGLVSYSGANIELHFLCKGEGVRLDHTRLVALKVNRLVGVDSP